jgi:flavin-dependent dehydrogenase
MLAAADKRDPDNRMHWVLGLDRGRTIGGWWLDGGNAFIWLCAEGSRDSVRSGFGSFLERTGERGLLPLAAAPDDSAIAMRPAPARLALEIDSHVEKRSLRIGDAGGFVAAASREGIYPAMWSAQLAVDVLARAAGGRHPQDALRQFSAAWRTTMAQYLRSPNTDIHLLLPLVFSNQQMADRMAGAFWRGENI